jgi:hypothetical protein
MFSSINFDQFNITISYLNLEVDMEEPCSFTINFKNSSNKIDELTNFIHYEGPLENKNENDEN